jgi:invasion protein IalB
MRPLPLLPFRPILACALAFCAAASAPTSAVAQTHKQAPSHPAKPAAPAAAPKQLGKFDDWIAATHQEAGQTVCYALSRAQNSTPSVRGRGDVVLTVTERASGRDAVALSAGFAFAQGAEVSVQVEQAGFQFYTAQRNAFARDGAAVVAAMQKGRQATTRSPGPHGKEIVDTFSLRGFTQAYAAIVKACPAK